MKTLGQFIIERQADVPFAKGELSRLLRDIGVAAKVISREVSRAGLNGILGNEGTSNVQGEQQQKLDVYANEKLIECLANGSECSGIASEENDHFIPIDSLLSKDAKYVVAIDPLDGSSNINVNGTVGTIFSIYRRISKSGPAILADIMQSGNKQVAAGYIIYGSSTMLIYTTGHGVNGFTLDPTIGEFCLSHPDLFIPANGNTYSINEGNYIHFSTGLKSFVSYCKAVPDAGRLPYTARYSGSMVADIHRNLINGGIFIYPSTNHAPNGKLRLVYECNPMAFIVEQAGGKASNGKVRILDLDILGLHQRSPLYIGSGEIVDQAEMMIRTEIYYQD